MITFRILAAVDINHRAPGVALLREALERYGDAQQLHAAFVFNLPAASYVSRVLPPETMEEVAGTLHEELNAMIAEAGGDGRIVPHILRGGVAEQIVRFGERLGVDLILLNAYRPDAHFATLGSNANQIVRRAPCSVLVRRQGPTTTP